MRKEKDKATKKNKKKTTTKKNKRTKQNKTKQSKTKQKQKQTNYNTTQNSKKYLKVSKRISQSVHRSTLGIVCSITGTCRVLVNLHESHLISKPRCPTAFLDKCEYQIKLSKFPIQCERHRV